MKKLIIFLWGCITLASSGLIFGQKSPEKLEFRDVEIKYLPDSTKPIIPITAGICFPHYFSLELTDLKSELPKISDKKSNKRDPLCVFIEVRVGEIRYLRLLSGKAFRPSSSDEETATDTWELAKSYKIIPFIPYSGESIFIRFEYYLFNQKQQRIQSSLNKIDRVLTHVEPGSELQIQLYDQWTTLRQQSTCHFKKGLHYWIENGIINEKIVDSLSSPPLLMGKYKITDKEFNNPKNDPEKVAGASTVNSHTIQILGSQFYPDIHQGTYWSRFQQALDLAIQGQAETAKRQYEFAVMELFANPSLSHLEKFYWRAYYDFHLHFILKDRWQCPPIFKDSLTCIPVEDPLSQIIYIALVNSWMMKGKLTAQEPLHKQRYFGLVNVMTNEELDEFRQLIYLDIKYPLPIRDVNQDLKTKLKDLFNGTVIRFNN